MSALKRDKFLLPVVILFVIVACVVFGFLIISVLRDAELVAKIIDVRLLSSAVPDPAVGMQAVLGISVMLATSLATLGVSVVAYKFARFSAEATLDVQRLTELSKAISPAIGTIYNVGVCFSRLVIEVVIGNYFFANANTRYRRMQEIAAFRQRLAQAWGALGVALDELYRSPLAMSLAVELYRLRTRPEPTRREGGGLPGVRIGGNKKCSEGFTKDEGVFAIRYIKEMVVMAERRVLDDSYPIENAVSLIRSPASGGSWSCELDFLALLIKDWEDAPNDWGCKTESLGGVAVLWALILILPFEIVGDEFEDRNGRNETFCDVVSNVLKITNEERKALSPVLEGVSVIPALAGSVHEIVGRWVRKMRILRDHAKVVHFGAAN